MSPNTTVKQDVCLGIVCPMANESATAAEFVRAVLEQCLSVTRVLFFAVVDRVSHDNTRQVLDALAQNELRLSVVWAPQNECVVDAYKAGYGAALQAGCDWILEIDAGFSHQPSDIPKFLRKMNEGYDCVFGSRFCEGGTIRESSTKRYLISRLGTFLANLLLGTRLSDMTSGFELFRASALDSVRNFIHSRGPFFQTEIRAHCHRYQIVEVPISYRNASHHVGFRCIADALTNLWRLFRLRLVGIL